MSLHYEWTLSLRLRPDTPEAFLEELRYHLGLSDPVPREPTLNCDGRALACASGGEELPGGAAASLVRQQPYLTRPAVWALFARTVVLDDAMHDLVQTVPEWLAGWSLTEGWIGFAREELGLNPWLNFYAMQGHAYAAPPGMAPEPLNHDAPRSHPPRPPTGGRYRDDRGAAGSAWRQNQQTAHDAGRWLKLPGRGPKRPAAIPNTSGAVRTRDQ